MKGRCVHYDQSFFLFFACVVFSLVVHRPDILFHGTNTKGLNQSFLKDFSLRRIMTEALLVTVKCD